MAEYSDGSIVIDTEIDSEGFKKDSKELNRAVKTLSTQVDQLGRKLETAISKGNTGAIDSLRGKMAESKKQLSEMQQQLEGFSRVKIQTEQYENVQTAIAKAEAALDKLLQREKKLKAMGVKESSKQWKNLQYDIEQAEKKLEHLNNAKDAMEANGTAYTTGGDTAEYEKLADRVEEAGSKLGSMKGRLSEIRSTSQSTLGKVGGLLASISKRALRAAASLAKMAGQTIVSGLKKLGSGLMQATKALLSLHKGGKRSNSMFQGGFKTLLKYGLGIRSLYVLFNKLRSALKEGIENVAKFDGPTNKAISSMMTALGQLKNAFGAAFQPIITAVAPYINSLLSMLSSAVAKIGEFIAALTGQKYVLRATAVQTDFAKSLDKTSKSAGNTAKAAKEAQKQLAGFDELNVLSDSSSNTGADSGAGATAAGFEKVPLTGISDFFKRIKEAFEHGDYEGIGRVFGEKINGVFQKVNDLINWANVGDTVRKYVGIICGIFNGLVYGIDWPLIGGTFAAGINTILNTLYLLLTGIDWDALAAGIGAGLSAMLNGIDWDTFGKTLALLLTLKLRMLANAMLAFDWASLGSNLAKGLNSAIDTVTEIITAIDWATLVKNFTAGLNSLVTGVNWPGLGNLLGFWMGTAISSLAKVVLTFDWAALGKGLAAGVNALAAQLLEAIQTVDWSGMGSNFMSGVNSIITGIDWKLLAQTLSTIFNGILSVIGSAIKTFKWEDTGAALGTAVTGVIGSINWAGLAQTISTGIKGLLKLAANFIRNLDWQTIVSAIGDFISNIDFVGIADSLFELLGAAIAAECNLAVVIGGLIKDAFTGIKKYFEEKVEACGGDIVAGIFEGICQALINVGKWIYDHIFTPFIKGFKSAFGIKSPSKVMAQMGGYLVEGLKNGLTGIWEAIKQCFVDMWDGIKTYFTGLNVKTWFTANVWDKITGAFSKAKETFAVLASFMWKGVTDYFSELGDKITTWFKENVWGAITDAFSNVKEWFKGMAADIWNGLTEGLSAGLEEAKKSVVGYFSDVWGGVLDLFGIESPSKLAKEDAGYLMEGFVIGAEDKKESAGKRLKAVFSSIYDAAKGVWDSVTGWLGKLFNWGKDDDDAKDSASKKASTAAGEVASGVQTAFANVETAISTPIANGVAAGEKSFETLKTAGETTAQSIEKAFTTSNNKIVTSFTLFLGSVNTTLAKGLNIAAKFVETKLGEMEKDVSNGFDSMRASASEGMTGIETSARLSLTAIRAALTTGLTGIRSETTATLTGIRTSATAGMQTILTSVNTGTNTIRTNITTAFTAARAAMSSAISGACGDITSRFTSMQASVSSSMSGMRQAIDWNISSARSSIVNGLQSAMNAAYGINWSGVGSNICSGIINGIYGGWSWLHDTVWHLAQSLYNNARAALGIHSPSRLFRDGVGKMLGLGTAEGVKDSEPAVLKSISSIAEAIGDEMRNADANADLGIRGEGLLNGLDDVLNAFSDRVSDSFSSLLDKLNTITGHVAFRTPAVADGTVLPYNVSAKSKGGSEGFAEALEASNEGLGDIIIQAVTNATAAIVQAIETYSGTQVNLDKKSLTDAVIEEINRRTKAQGKSPILL